MSIIRHLVFLQFVTMWAIPASDSWIPSMLTYFENKHYLECTRDNYITMTLLLPSLTNVCFVNDTKSMVLQESNQTINHSTTRRNKKASNSKGYFARKLHNQDEHTHMTRLFSKFKKQKELRLLSAKNAKILAELEDFISGNFPMSYHVFSETEEDKAIANILNVLEEKVNSAAKLKSLENLTEPLKMYKELLLVNNHSQRVLLQNGIALSLSYYLNRSSRDYQDAINSFNDILYLPHVSEKNFKTAVLKCVKLLSDRQLFDRAIDYQLKITEKFPNSTTALNELGNLYWNAGQSLAAKSVFELAYAIDPEDCSALLNLAYVLYFDATDIINKGHALKDKAVQILNKVVILIESTRNTNSLYTMNRKYFYLWANAFRLMDRYDEANKVFEEAVQRNIFPSYWQRTSQLTVSGFKSKPIWSLKETGISSILRMIKKRWKDVRVEALSILRRGMFERHPENLRDNGNWFVYNIYSGGKRINSNCMEAPITCSLVEYIPDIATNWKGSVKFSMMESGTHVFSHSGATNCKLRIHLALDVPSHSRGNSAAASHSRLRVLNEYLTWKNGDMVIFDDSFDHEVWHYNKKNHSRLILIIDMWHPYLTESDMDLLYH